MVSLSLHDRYQGLGARFTEVNGMEVVEHFGDPEGECEALLSKAGVLDLSFRSRLCLTGADRKRFLHGQVTNNINSLTVGQGCYAALTTAKGKMQSDLYIYCLLEELLLDFEPGLSAMVAQRFENYVIADDVQVVDVAPHYGLLSVQGPEARAVLKQAALISGIPDEPLKFTSASTPALGEMYCINQPRAGAAGFDLFVPAQQLSFAFEKLWAASQAAGGRVCGWQALERVRIEAGIPRFGADMDETNLPPETGIEDRAVSYSKGCYIGQEVIARIRTYGQVTKSLRRLRLADDLPELPGKGDKLYHTGKEAGYITSATVSKASKAKIALGYVRREFQEPGAQLVLRSAAGESVAKLE